MSNERFEMACTRCGLLQPGWIESKPDSDGNTIRRRTEYCKYNLHETKFGKRLKTLVNNDQDEAEAIDGGTYRISQLKDDALLTVNEGEHPSACICTVCQCGDEDRSFEDPYERETLVDLEAEIMKFVKTNGLYGMDLATAERKRRQLERNSISKPEIKVGEQMESYTMKTPCGMRGKRITHGVEKKLFYQPIVSRNKKWNGSIPQYATKEALDSFQPKVMKNIAKQGDMLSLIHI